jgi:DNA-binding response OmpR family regulator
MLGMVSYPHRLKSGHVMCYLNRTYHVPTTAVPEPVDSQSTEMHHDQNMRILVVEDETKVANFIARTLREQGYQVEVAESGEVGLSMATAAVYQAVVLDLRLPGMDGIQVCRELRRSGFETPILMLTARSMVEQRVEGLDAGADDYLVKPFVLAELHARVRALTRRSQHNRSRVMSFADLEIDRERRRTTRGGKDIPLTPKEFSVLELLLMRAPETVSRSEIIEYVWSYGFDSETNLVEVYVNRLRQKVDADPVQRLIHTVRGVGYRLGQGE